MLEKTYIELSEDRIGQLAWSEDLGYNLTIFTQVYPNPARATYFSQQDLKKIITAIVAPVKEDLDEFIQQFRESMLPSPPQALSFVDWLFSTVEIEETDFENAD